MYKHSQQTANIPTSKYLRYAIHFALLPGEKTKMYKYIHCSVHCTIMTEHYPTHLAMKLLISTIKISLQLISELMEIGYSKSSKIWILERTKHWNLFALKVIHVHDCTIHVLANAIKSLKNGAEKKKKGVFMGGVVVHNPDI